MRHINPLKAGMSVGAVNGLSHFAWVALVGVGWAKPVMDLILRLHFLDFDYRLLPFSFATAATLVFLTTFIGLFLGILFALVWNWLTFETPPEWARDTSNDAVSAPVQLGGS